jgi:hypothetical protein
MILKLESNPGLVKEGDLVLYLTHRKSGKTIAHLGECVKGYGEGYCVRNLKTGKIDYPYTQDTVLVNEGIQAFGVSSQIVILNKV